MIISPEKPEDIAAIRSLNELAFGRPQEAKIVDNLRNNCAGLLSLVAVVSDKIVGHILFSPAVIEGQHGTLKGMGLAPMAVLPGMQRQGIGAQLVRKGIENLKTTHCPFIIVLGHARYYPRFGFEKASLYGVKCQWEGVPDEAFMICWLERSTMPPVSGFAKYRKEFEDAVD